MTYASDRKRENLIMLEILAGLDKKPPKDLKKAKDPSTASVLRRRALPRPTIRGRRTCTSSPS